MGLALVLAGLVRVFRALAGACLGFAFARRPQLHACASGHGQSDGDGLLGRSGAMRAAMDLVNLLVDELTGLSARRLTGAPVLASLRDRSLLGHCHLQSSGFSILTSGSHSGCMRGPAQPSP